MGFVFFDMPVLLIPVLIIFALHIIPYFTGYKPIFTAANVLAHISVIVCAALYGGDTEDIILFLSASCAVCFGVMIAYNKKTDCGEDSEK